MKRRRVGNFAAVMMIGLAVFFDLLQFFVFFLNVIPGVGTALAFIGDYFITGLSYIAFYLVWFPLLGVSLSKGKPTMLMNVLISGVIEMTPILDILPGITYGVGSTVFLSRVEDAAYNKENAEKIRNAQVGIQQQAAQDRAQQEAFIAQQNEIQAANDNEEAAEESAQEAA